MFGVDLVEKEDDRRFVVMNRYAGKGRREEEREDCFGEIMGLGGIGNGDDWRKKESVIVLTLQITQLISTIILLTQTPTLSHFSLVHISYGP